MFFVVLAAICSVLHADWEYVNTWSVFVEVQKFNFSVREGEYWDPSYSDQADVRLVVGLGPSPVIATSEICSNCHPNANYSVSRSISLPSLGTEAAIVSAKYHIVTVQMWDNDDGADDLMGSNTLDLRNYKSNGASRTVAVKMSGDFKYDSYVWVGVGMYPATITACTSRTPISDSCHSNADSYLSQPGCFRQLNRNGNGTGLNSCSTTCPAYISSGAYGKCSLNSCNSREVSTDFKYWCGTSDCYAQLSRSGNGTTYTWQCNTACPGIANTNADGTCVLKPNCNDRQANTSYLYPCGTSICYQQMNAGHDGYLSGSAGSCSTTCPSGLTTAAGRCTLDPDCPGRHANALAAYPCGGSTCYQQLNSTGDGTYLSGGAGSCNTSCPVEISDRNNNGKCMLKPCYDREVNTAHSFPCGTSDCFQQLDYTGDNGTLHTTCNDNCPSSLSDGSNTTGTCVLKDCALRFSDSSHVYPCGTSDCFQQLDYAGDGTLHRTCDVSCPSGLSEIPDGNNTAGTCVLKDCALRVSDSSHTYPCGTSDCFQQLDNTCDVSCPSNLTDEGNMTGTCVLKDCALRVSDSSHTYPCGTSDCFLQLDFTGGGDGTLHTTCDVSCPSSLSDKNSAAGTCVLKDCDLRIFNSSHTYPCGTSDCYQQTKDGTKTNECGTQQSQSKSKQRTIIIVAVVVSVFVVLVVVAVIIIVVVLRRRQKQQSYLLADWDCQRGSEIKNYSVRDNIGTSQNSKLYEFINSGKIYTAKCVCPEDGGSPQGDLNWAEDFSEKIDSKFLVKYFETIRGKKGESYLVMEHFEHENLQALLNSLKKVTKDALLTPDRIMKILIQVLFGLEVLHRHGVIHCDLSTETIYIDENDDAKIGAFGCTQREKTHSREQEMQNLGYVRSSNQSPEVLAGGRCTFYTDMWCLGRVCYKLCRFPNDIDDGNQMVRQLKAPDALIEIIDSLLNQNPDERPSASTLLQHPFIREYSKQLHLVEF